MQPNAEEFTGSFHYKHLYKCHFKKWRFNPLLGGRREQFKQLLPIGGYKNQSPASLKLPHRGQGVTASPR